MAKSTAQIESFIARGEQIHYRKQLGWTLASIANELGISHQAVAQTYERYKKIVPVGTSNIFNYQLADNWDDVLEVKQRSIYYTLLVKDKGKERADEIWDKRYIDEHNLDIWNLVKNYKPKDKLSLVTDIAWGYESIKALDDEREEKSK